MPPTPSGGFRDFTWATRRVLDCRTFDLTLRAWPGATVGPPPEGNGTAELIAESEADLALVARLNEISVRWRKGADERGLHDGDEHRGGKPGPRSTARGGLARRVRRTAEVPAVP